MKRKLFYLQTIYVTFLLLFLSCEKETSVALPIIGEVTYEVGYGEITFYWNIPENENVESVRVAFVDEGKDKLYTFSRFSGGEALISSLGAKEYTFSITTADKSGNLSDPVVIVATPLQPAYMIAAESLKISPVIGGLVVRWDNPTEKEVQINVEYLDNEGARKIYTSVSSDEKAERYILAVSSEEQVINFYTSNPGNYLQVSEIKTATVQPYLEVQFDDRSNWTILDFSSAFNQDLPEKIFDGDLTSFWQTRWSPAPPDPYPHYVEFDMGSERIVSSLGFYHRDHNNANNAPTHFTVEGSLDGEEWEVHGNYDDFPTTRNVEIMYGLESVQNVRFLRITFNNPRNTQNFALAELYVYGAFL